MAIHYYGLCSKREFSHSYLREVSLPGRFGLRAYPAYERGSPVHKQGKTHDDTSDSENQLLQVPQNTEASRRRQNRWKDSAHNAFLESQTKDKINEIDQFRRHDDKGLCVLDSNDGSLRLTGCGISAECGTRN